MICQSQVRAIILLFSSILFGWSALAQNENLVRDIHYFRLPNGLQLMVAVRPEMQLTAVNLTVNLGSIDDPPGMAGIAHLLEHVTLSGSISVGSLNPEAEARALTDLDRAYASLAREQAKTDPDPTVVAGLERWFEEAQERAVRTAEAGEILGGRLEAHGAVGLNATTTADATQFFGSIPPNELEYWMSLEAERLRHPIFRRFYLERNVVLREVLSLTGGRRTPQERLLEELFPGAPVAQPLAGDVNQIRKIDRPAALRYFHLYYRPENIAIAIVGNVDPKSVFRMCLAYFGDWQPEGERGVQRSKREHAAHPTTAFIRSFSSPQGPIVFFAIPQPPSGAVQPALLRTIAELINSEELSPVARELVQNKGMAWQVGAVADYPSRKETPIFLVHVYGSAGNSSQLLVQATSNLLRALADTSEEEVKGAILAGEMRLAAQLDDSSTLASQLGLCAAVEGNWRLPFQELAALRELKVNAFWAATKELFATLASQNARSIGGKR